MKEQQVLLDTLQRLLKRFWKIRFVCVFTPNCNNVVIEKKQKAKKLNRNKLAMWFTFAYFNSVFINYLRIHSQ